MASNTQALADLTQLITDLSTAVQNVSNEFANLLTAIKNNNGVNPGAIETLVTSGEALVGSLNAAVTAAQNALNPPTPVAVSVSPTSATVAPGGSQSFSATVTGSTNTAVAWSLQAGAQGSIDTNGNYSVPAAATPGTDTVTATSQADTTKSASASVTIS